MSRLSDPIARARFAAGMRPIITAIQTAGVVGFGAIADVLNARAIRTARGARWHASTVRNLLARA